MYIEQRGKQTNLSGDETMKTINIIPSDYKGDPKKALGYCWSDYMTKTPGDDVIAEITDDGIDYIAVAKAKMAELGVEEAYINCMWCGGFKGEITSDNANTVDAQPAPLSFDEVAANEAISEKMELDMLDSNNKTHPGWCTICHTYCYGDCEAQ